MFNNPYYYHPYMNQMPQGMPVRGRGGFFKSLTGIKWGTVLNNTQKTLNVINQAIPVYYQIKPIFGNLKSFGRLMSAFNEADPEPIKAENQAQQFQKTKKENRNSPTFFIDSYYE